MKRGILFLLILLCGLPGCGNIIDWGKEKFYQGEKVDSYSAQVKPHIRSKIVYDQFSTRAMFDALYLNNSVRTAYANAHALRLGKSSDQYDSLLRRQLEENKHFIAFYLLSPYEVPLGEGVDWTVFLRINGQNFAPKELKAIELVPEYRAFFNKRMNRFKVPYIIKFDAQDLQENPLITQETEKITLVFRSLDKEVTLDWILKEGK